LARLSYLPFEEIVPGPDSSDSISISDSAVRFFSLSQNQRMPQSSSIVQKEDPLLLSVLGASIRYRNLHLAHFVNNIDISKEKQFAALTIFGKNLSPYISFRGTDLTLVGWKEDFNMSFLSAIPSQLDAVAYLENIAKKFKKPLRVGGHSKGGNLAVYASAFCDKKIQKRIIEVYNNDGPGFRSEIIAKPSFQAILHKIHTFIPQSSIVGMLLEHDEEYMVVESIQKGILQHDLYSWNVTYNDVVRLDAVTSDSKFIDKTIKEWLNSLDSEQRKEMVNYIYEIFTSTHCNTLQELTSQWQKSAVVMLKKMSNLDASAKKNLSQIFSILVKAAKNNINYILPEPLVQIQKHPLFHQNKIEASHNDVT
jgi:hypothetical protein